MYYQKHLFFCHNQKRPGKMCCAQGAPEAKRDYAKAKLKKMGVLVGEGGVRVSLSGCLGRCEEGPILLIYPDGVWYRYQNEADIDKILQQHVVAGQIVEELAI